MRSELQPPKLAQHHVKLCLELSDSLELNLGLGLELRERVVQVCEDGRVHISPGFSRLASRSTLPGRTRSASCARLNRQPFRALPAFRTDELSLMFVSTTPRGRPPRCGPSVFRTRPVIPQDFATDWPALLTGLRMLWRKPITHNWHRRASSCRLRLTARSEARQCSKPRKAHSNPKTNEADAAVSVWNNRGVVSERALLSAGDRCCRRSASGSHRLARWSNAH